MIRRDHIWLIWQLRVCSWQNLQVGKGTGLNASEFNWILVTYQWKIPYLVITILINSQSFTVHNLVKWVGLRNVLTHLILPELIYCKQFSEIIRATKCTHTSYITWTLLKKYFDFIQRSWKCHVILRGVTNQIMRLRRQHPMSRFSIFKACGTI